MIIRKKAYARGALVGNPSDGYFGKTIALTFSNFFAEVVLYESPHLEILPAGRDHSVFHGIHELAEDVNLYGYYGGIRLLKATIKRFHDYCIAHELPLSDRNFTLSYSSTIPHLVGLAGSSAIITAAMRALMSFYGVRIPRPVLANLILSVEREELGISAGLQDRVAQVYQGLVYMNFDRQKMESLGHGMYEQLDAGSLPPLYIAYREDLSQGSEIFHDDIKQRFRRNDPEVLEAMRFWAELTDQVRDCLEQGRQEAIGGLLNANFDRRAALYPISEGNLRMVEAARRVGASAKFTGSGGAIIGTFENDAMYSRLQATLEPLAVTVLRPALVPPVEEDIG